MNLHRCLCWFHWIFILLGRVHCGAKNLTCRKGVLLVYNVSIIVLSVTIFLSISIDAKRKNPNFSRAVGYYVSSLMGLAWSIVTHLFTFYISFKGHFSVGKTGFTSNVLISPRVKIMMVVLALLLFGFTTTGCILSGIGGLYDSVHGCIYPNATFSVWDGYVSCILLLDISLAFHHMGTTWLIAYYMSFCCVIIGLEFASFTRVLQSKAINEVDMEK